MANTTTLAPWTSVSWNSSASTPKRSRNNSAPIKATLALGRTSVMKEGVPTDPEARAFFNELHSKVAQHREDIATWFDLLDLDDYVSFGGKA